MEVNKRIKEALIYILKRSGDKPYRPRGYTVLDRNRYTETYALVEKHGLGVLRCIFDGSIPGRPLYLYRYAGAGIERVVAELGVLKKMLETRIGYAVEDYVSSLWDEKCAEPVRSPPTLLDVAPDTRCFGPLGADTCVVGDDYMRIPYSVFLGYPGTPVYLAVRADLELRLSCGNILFRVAGIVPEYVFSVFPSSTSL